MLNICLVVGAVSSGQGQLTPGVIVPASYRSKYFSFGENIFYVYLQLFVVQVLYAMDALYHEHFYFHSTDYLQSGYGWSLASSYLTFPFLATLATRYTVTSAVRT